MSSPIPARVRVLLAELELISHGSTTSWNAAGGGSGPGSRIPAGETQPPHIVLRDAYLTATTLDERAGVEHRMRKELGRARRGASTTAVIGESRHDESLRILAEGEGFGPDEVARHFHCTPTRVRTLRLAAGYDADLGREPEDRSAAPVADPEDELRAAAVRLKRRGMSVRLIGLELGRPKSTINDWLRGAA